MKATFLICFLYLLFVCFAPVSAQNVSPTESKTDKEKAQKEAEKRVLEMLDQAVGEAATLKLPQNRAAVYAVAGDLYWKFDAKHAAELFRNAGNEIVIANAESEKDKKENDDPYAELFDFNNVRNDILPLIAKHDADLALNIMQQTRPAKLAEAMAKAAQPNAKQGGGMMTFDPAQFAVQREIGLEQQFAVLAAEQDPEKAVQLIKESLAKGISYNVLPLLQKLNLKDEKKAQDVANEVVRKISDADLSKKREDLSAAVRFLQAATNPNAAKNPKEKQFKFTDEQLKTIADKVTDTFLQPSNSMEMTMLAMQAMPSLEKFAPAKLVLLKQKQIEAEKNMPPEMKAIQRQQNLWNPNSTPEEILAELPKMNEFEKTQANQSLQYKIAQIEDEARAKKLIEQIPDEKTRTDATEAFESAKISRTAKDGKLDEAKKLIGNLTKKKTQIQKFVALAVEFNKKNTDQDRETAAGLMKSAKNLVNESPEDEDELNDLMEVVKGYAVVNPNEAFRLFEPIIDQINDYVQASAILSKYNKNSQNFKKAELVMKVNGNQWEGLLLFKYVKQIQMLGKADLNRMIIFSDKFQRSDARTIVKLFVAQGFLNDDKKDDTENSGTNYYFSSE